MYALAKATIALMHKTIDKILARLMADRGVNQLSLAKATGLQQSTISRILKPQGPKGIKSPSDAQVHPLAKYFELSSDQLRGHYPIPEDYFSRARISLSRLDEFTSDPEPLVARSIPFDLKRSDDYVGISQLTASASAGPGEENSHVEIRGVLAFKAEWLRAKRVKPENLTVIYAKGESMWPTISDHDVLLVDESRVEPVDGSVFVLKSQERGTIVKRLIRSDFDGWIIRSDNPDKITYGDETLPDGEIYEHHILGQVIWRGGDL